MTSLPVTRVHIRNLLVELDLPTVHISFEHVPYLRAAKIDPVPLLAMRVPEALNRLNDTQTIALMDALLDPEVA